MIEWLWVGLLALGVSHRASRALALLLALKWASNYTAFQLIGETAPALIDVGLGTVGVIWASRAHSWWADVVIAGFVLTPFVHGWYWFQYGPGPASAQTYYWLLLGLFTLQAAAVAWPAAAQVGRIATRRLKRLRTRRQTG
jgi:hypothetical protein